ncbi:putative membrane protein YkoI [Povalibacter uvarum]|uniref:Putative membrane protein YkoI n=1 Tax=Povalibacter uvarum TaxID=732238 RepID=A0A841HHD3_9GAMM|nr:PepSY domain-containing protein [Povalibacter uvarum]MBB6092186.1 putative membrane protein YkoI [Povalibacter uvarum]
MRSRFSILALFAALVLAVGTPVANAQNLIEKRPRSDRQAERPRVSLDQAVNMAESRYRAKAVKTQQSVSGDRVVYHIRLLSGDGRVWTVQVDAQTGQMY